jgi:hypothetical protein
MSILSITAFEASTVDILATPNQSFGSCAFELAHLLKLLPGQSRASLRETETVSLQELFYDSETCYGKFSREGLLCLIT